MSKLRNTIARALVVATVIASAIVSSSLLFVLVTYGPDYIKLADFGSGYFQRNLVSVEYLWQQVWYYLTWMVQNHTLVSFSDNNYWVAKMLGIPTIVNSIFVLILVANYQNLKNWTPFEKKEKIYGDARWATEEDIEKAHLRAKHGLLLGRDKDGYLIEDSCQHALLFAPTGSGKGVGFVIPNCLCWEGSLVVHDTKLENFEKTSGWRVKMGQKCYVWAPADPDGHTHCYNPMDWISSKPGQMVDDVQKMANLILPKQDFWENEARTLFVGIVLYLLSVPEKMKSFGEVVRTIRSDDVAYNLAHTTGQ